MEKEEQQTLFYATTWCPDCIRARRVMDKENVNYKLIDIDKDPKGKEYVMSVNHGNKSVPTIVFPDGSILVEPSKDALLEKLNSYK